MKRKNVSATRLLMTGLFHRKAGIKPLTRRIGTTKQSQIQELFAILSKAEQLLKLNQIELEPMRLTEGNVTDVIYDLIQTSGLLSSEVFKKAVLGDGNQIRIRLASGQSFLVTIVEE